jgi:single-strand DNA-binding protein
MNLNKAQLIGRVGKDAPEMKYTPSGKAVTKFSLATSYKNGDKEITDWHNIICWNGLAESVNEWVVPGQELYVEGRIQYRSWDKEDGTKGYITEIVANEVKFGAKPGGAKGNGNGATQRASQPAPASVSASEEEFPF